MAKQLTAHKLMIFLTKLQVSGVDLKKVVVNHRADRDSDVEAIEVVEEDLFDEKTNNVLESIVLITDKRDV